jgi:hypothetical protein
MSLETVGDNCLLRTAGKKPSCPQAFSIFFFERGQIDYRITNFLGTFGHSPIETSLWTPSHKIETNVLPYGPPFQFGYMGMEVWANHVG